MAAGCCRNHIGRMSPDAIAATRPPRTTRQPGRRSCCSPDGTGAPKAAIRGSIRTKFAWMPRPRRSPPAVSSHCGGPTQRARGRDVQPAHPAGGAAPRPRRRPADRPPIFRPAPRAGAQTARAAVRRPIIALSMPKPTGCPGLVVDRLGRFSSSSRMPPAWRGSSRSSSMRSASY